MKPGTRRAVFRPLEDTLAKLRRFVRRQVHGRAQEDADAMATEVGMLVEHRSGSRHDAFTHAYVSARLTIALGPELAERLGDLNEMLGSLAAGKKLEAEMDRHNNAVGRGLGLRLDHRGTRSRIEIARSVNEALEQGRLKVIDRIGGKQTLVSTRRSRTGDRRDSFREQ